MREGRLVVCRVCGRVVRAVPLSSGGLFFEVADHRRPPSEVLRLGADYGRAEPCSGVGDIVARAVTANG